MSERSLWGGRLAWALVVLLFSSGPAAPQGPTVASLLVPSSRLQSPSCTTVNYTSTVDQFPLSYSECLPANFSNATAYRLIVYLHGIDETKTTPQSGGYPTTVNTTWATVSADRGYIFLAVNTRTGVGFYADSNFTGPQRQDVLDAIHSEALRHRVAATYLLGASMGAGGALAIAAAEPTAYAGVGAVVPFPDYFQEYAYQRWLHNPNPTADFMTAISGGLVPAQSASALALWMSLSPLRFDPGAFAHLRLYAVAGEEDLAVPSNATAWSYQQSNSTFVNRSCNVATSIGEPANCTTPLAILAALHPGSYPFRYVYEPDGIHATNDLNFTDLLDFWEQKVPPGIFWAAIGHTPVEPPQAVVEFATIPSTCGSVTFVGAAEPFGRYTVVPPGFYPVDASPCAGTRLETFEALGNATYDGANSTVNITGHAVLVASFVPLPPPSRWTAVVEVSPETCGPVELNGSAVASGGSVELPNGTYSLRAPACDGFSFVNWTATGGISVSSARTNSTSLTLDANGSVTALYQSVSPPPPPSFTVTVGVSPPECGSVVVVAGTPYGDGTPISLRAGNYTVSADSCGGFEFSGWNVSGLVAITDGELQVMGSGTLLATYRELPISSSPSTSGLSTTWLLVGVGAVALLAAGGAVVWALRSRTRP